MSRRANGEGSYSTLRDGRTRWTVMHDGRRVYGYGATRALAKSDGLRKIGRPISADVTVGEWLAEWLDGPACADLKPTTRATYEQQVRLRLAPLVGRVKLADLSPRHVRDLHARLARQGASTRQQGKAHTVLRSALADALRMELVARNAAAVERPPRHRYAEPSPLTVDQAAGLLLAARGTRMAAYWTLALLLGLREGELLGLEWSDADLDQDVLHIRAALVRVGREWLRQPTKTAGSARTIQLPPQAVAALRGHRAAQTAQRLATRPTAVWEARWDLVFRSPAGQPVHASLVRRDLHRLCDAAGVPRVRVHDLRHTTGSLLAELEVPQRTIMSVLAHATLAMSARYTTGADRAAGGAVARLAEALG